MVKEEMKQKIIDLNYEIDKEKIKKSGALLFMGITMFTILGGGLAFGLILGSLPKIMMLAVATTALVNVPFFKKIGDSNNLIKRYRHQIKDYQTKINRTTEPKAKKLEIKETKEEKIDYSYKPTNREVKIDTFSEADFDEEYDKESSKRR